MVWGINTHNPELPALVVFPGFRTVSLFWDFDRGLDTLREKCRIFLVDTNGQPCLSDGNTPDIHSLDYGWWAASVLQKLEVEKAVVAGASFGALVCLKLCQVAPKMVEKAILLNPGCLQPFSLKLPNLYYNLLPILFPSRKNVKSFLQKAVFYKNEHTLSPEAFELILDYEQFALTRFIDKAQKPYAFSEAELSSIQNDVYLLLGEKDRLFPYQRSLKVAQQHLKNLKEVLVIPETGHGIDTSGKAMAIINRLIEK